MFTAILLSAGLSQRFGSPKALADLNGQTVIEHLQHMLIASHTSEIIVVLGAHANEIKPHLLNHKKVKFVYNKDYKFGQTSSFRAGLRHISDEVKGVLLLPVDYPLVRTETIDTLIRNFLTHSSLIVLPSFNNKKGHPPLFSTQLKEEFLKLDNETGINSVAHAHQDETAIFPVEDAGVIKSFNTPEEFEHLKK